MHTGSHFACICVLLPFLTCKYEEYGLCGEGGRKRKQKRKAKSTLHQEFKLPLIPKYDNLKKLSVQVAG